MPPDLIPVDYDPFSDAANAFPTFQPAAPASDLPQPLFNDFQVNQGFKPFNKLFGTGGETRHVLWPEQMVRRGADVVHSAWEGNNQLESALVPGAQPVGSQDASYEPNLLGRALGMTEPWTAPGHESGIAKVQDLSGLMAGGPLIERPGAATLGTGAMRTGSDKFYPLEQSGSWFAKGGNSELKVGPFASKAEVDAYIASKGGEGPSSPPFYSAVEAAVRDASQASMSPEQWRGYLSNRPGVKAEELDWVGMPEGKKVSKQEMLDHVQEHGVQVKEVEKSLNTTNANTIDRVVEANLDDHVDQFRKDYKREPNAEELNYLRNAIRDQIHDFPEDFEFTSNELGGPKFSEYQLPGGENYREKLFTLPSKAETASAKDKARGEKLARMPHDERVRQGVQEEYEKHIDAQDDLGNYIKPLSRNEQADYRSSHWDEPNVLAHVRMNDRTIPDAAIDPRFKEIGDRIERGGIGAITPEERALYNELDARGGNKGLKTLHLEELQSDWHQAGRKQGYKGAGEGVTSEIAAISKRVDGSGRQTDPNYWSGAALTDAVNAGRITEGEAGQVMRWQQDNTPSGRVPDAPFKTTWPDLVLKRMIREAAENGYDAISWTPGEAQAARYDLSKQIERLHYEPQGNGTYLIGAVDKNGRAVHLNDGKPIPQTKLSDFIGKDVADRIVQDKGTLDTKMYGKDTNIKYLDGVDLKVGGEGMKGFYDKMLVDKANALAKKFGGKVEYKDIGNNMEISEHPKYQEPGSVFKVMSDDPELTGVFASRAEAEAYVKQHSHKVPVLRLTPQMRDTALRKGFPLFASGSPFPLVPVDHDPFKETK